MVHILGVLVLGFTGGVGALIPSALWYSEWSQLGAVLATMLIGGLFGGGLWLAGRRSRRDFFRREAVAVTALAWIVASTIGALPFYFGGLDSGFINCLFESTSGLTTTGSSILTSIEDKPKTLLLWRSLLHFYGGFGIIVFFVVLMPSFAMGGKSMFKQEVAGPVVEGLTPRIRETAVKLFYLYIGLVAALTVLLLLFGGLNFIEALHHAMATVATGGFSPENTSVLTYTPLTQWILTIGMFVSAANFTLHLEALKGNFKAYWQSSEFLTFLGIVVGSSLLIAGLLWYHKTAAVSHPGELNLRDAAFNVVSMMSTTGFCTVNFNEWPEASRYLLICVMIIGGMVGGTSGGFKVVRLVILVKALYYEVKREISPRQVAAMKMDGRPINPEVVRGVVMYFAAYFCLVIVSGFLVAIMNNHISLLSSLTAVFTCINGCGPGLDVVGPWGNFNSLTGLSKFYLCFIMLAGRLEIYPMLLLFSRRFWSPN